MRIKVTVTGAWIDGEFIDADDYLVFEADIGARSILHQVDHFGKAMWRERYWEVPDQLVYTYIFVEDEK